MKFNKKIVNVKREDKKLIVSEFMRNDGFGFNIVNRGIEFNLINTALTNNLAVNTNNYKNKKTRH